MSESCAELKDEVARLKQDIRDIRAEGTRQRKALQAELDAARMRVADLEEELNRLTKAR